MDIILLVLHVVLSLGIITLVLLQKGAGASAGAAFGGGGGGGAGSVFGATGSANFLSKTTAIFAVAFFINSLVLAYIAANREIQSESVLDALIEQPATELSVPAPSENSIDVPMADIPAADNVDVPAATDIPPPVSE
ncbi:Protein translocase membrane subunit SecG [hydrothermal vent metagenome]|uniref:Protein translocase membrane subunit SecG n=1 Tax=hydrothermal vent metagenome TaxID=652676 RepID=A0A3B0W6Q8_9ZZZZ